MGLISVWLCFVKTMIDSEKFCNVKLVVFVEKEGNSY